ncbi:MAG: hypothetical protein ABIH50_05950 [bacterium]
MKKDLSSISIKDLAVFVSTQLRKYRINAVLTGGSCVTIYSKNEYQSLDLDFVTSAVDLHGKKIKAVMAEIGFELAAQGFFAHPKCPYIIEFLSPPLSVGREPVKSVRKIKTKVGELRLLSPTDCVKDRLAAYFHWNDQQSLGQALMVYRQQKIDLKELKRWAIVEGQNEKYQHFIKQTQKNVR